MNIPDEWELILQVEIGPYVVGKSTQLDDFSVSTA
jgi:hypothetical protein